MASPVLALLAFSATLLLTAAADSCDGYFNREGVFIRPLSCSRLQFCCGTCEDRYCCLDLYRKLDDDYCFSSDYKIIPIATGVVTVIIILALIVTCCICPCCCLYKMCRKPRPVTATTTTTVVTTQYPRQHPPNASTPYPAYQTVPAQPGYGAQPVYVGQAMPPAPYQGQPAHGPPPPYQESGMYPAPYSQAAYDGGQAPYPLNPPVQPSFAHPPPATTDSAAQPPYNPAYMEPPKPRY